MKKFISLLAGALLLAIPVAAKADFYCEERVGTEEACEPWLYNVSMKARITNIESILEIWPDSQQSPTIIRNAHLPSNLTVGDKVEFHLFFNLYQQSYNWNFQFTLGGTTFYENADFTTHYFEYSVTPTRINFISFYKQVPSDNGIIHYIFDGQSYGLSDVQSDLYSIDMDVRNFGGLIQFNSSMGDASLYQSVFFDTEYPGRTSVIPEPSTWAMLIAGFGLVGGAIRQKRRPANASLV